MLHMSLITSVSFSASEPGTVIPQNLIPNQSSLNMIQTFRLCVCWMSIHGTQFPTSGQRIALSQVWEQLLLYEFIPCFSNCSALRNTFAVRSPELHARHSCPYFLNIFLQTILNPLTTFFLNLSLIASNAILKIMGLLC